MSDSYLLKSYRAQEDAALDRDLDALLARRSSAESAETPTPAGGPEGRESGGGTGGDYPDPGTQAPSAGTEKPAEKSGVVASLARGAAEVPRRFTQGGKAVADMLLPPDGSAPGGAANTLKGFIGLLDTVFPFAGFANEVGGDAAAWLMKISGELSDDRLRAKLTAAQARGAATAGPGEGGAEFSTVGNDEAALIEGLLAVPEAERLRQVKEAFGLGAEILSGFIPGYAGAVKVAGKLAGNAAKGVTTAAVAKPAMKALGEGTPQAHKAGEVIAAPGKIAGKPGQTTIQNMDVPGHQQTMTDIMQRALEARRAGERAQPGPISDRLGGGDAAAGAAAKLGDPPQTGAPGAAKAIDEVAAANPNALAPDDAPAIGEAIPRPSARDQWDAERKVRERNRAEFEQVRRNEAILPKTFDPQAYAASKESVYQGQWPGQDIHEFRYDGPGPAKSGNFTVVGELTPETVDAAQAALFARFAAADKLAPAAESALKAADAIPDGGFAKPALVAALARAAVGAAVGGSIGEDPQQRAFNALVGAGVGSVASRTIARKVADAVSNREIRAALTSEQGAIFPKRAPEQMPNPRRMGTGAETKQLVRGVNARLSELGHLTRDTAVTHAETKAASASSKYRNVENVLRLDDDTALNAADSLAARDMRDRSLEDLLISAAKAKEDPALLDVVWDQYLLASKITEKVTNVDTASARALEARKIVTDPKRAAKLDYDELSKELNEYGRALGGAGVSKENIVDALLELGDRAKIAKLARDAKEAPSAWWKIYYGLNLLSTPLFHPKNLFGDSSALMMQMASRLVGEVVSVPFNAFGIRNDGAALVAPGETMDLVIGVVESFRDAMRAGVSTFKTGESMFGASKYAERLNINEGHLAAMSTPSGMLARVVDTTARIANGNLRFASGTDEFFKVLAFVGEQRALARRKAWSEGASLKDIGAKQAEYINTPTKDMLAGALEFAQDSTFTRPFKHGSFMDKAEQFAGTTGMRLTLTPFFHTPMRIAEFGTEFTPGLNLLSAGFYGDMKAGGAHAQVAMAKLAVGGGMMMVLASYAQAGYITGDWSHDPSLRARQKEAKFKPFSVYVPAFDKYVSYNGLGPLVAPIAAVAQYMQMAPHLKDDGVGTLFMAMTIAMMKTALAQPYFDSVNDFTSIFEAMDEQGSVEKGMRYVEDRVRALIPGSSALRAIAAATDPDLKDPKSFDPEWGEVFTLFGRTAAGLPGLSTTVPAYLDVIEGKPIPREGGPFAGMISTPSRDPVRHELLILQGAGIPPEVPRTISGTRASSDFRVTAPAPGAVFPLTHEQRVKLTKLMTQEVEIGGETLRDAMQTMIDSADYKAQQGGKNGGKANRLNKLWHTFLHKAEEDLMKEDPDLRELVRRSRVEKMLPKAPTDSLPELRERLLQ